MPGTISSPTAAPPSSTASSSRVLIFSPSTAQEISADHNGIVKPSTAD